MDPLHVIWLGLSALHLILALAFTMLNFQDRLNRSFSLYLFFQGGFFATRTISSSGPWAAFHEMSHYLALAAPFPLLYLGAAYTERSGGPRIRRAAFWILLTLAVLAQATYIADPSLMAGPLMTVHGSLALFAMSSLAALLVRQALRQQNVLAAGLLNAALGLTLFPLAYGLHLFVPGLMRTPEADLWMIALALVPVSFVVWMMFQTATGAPSLMRRRARRSLAILSLAPASVLALVIAQQMMPQRMLVLFMVILMSAWGGLMILIVAYSIARNQLFGIELRLKWTIQRGSIATAVVAVFLIVSQAVEVLAHDVLGTSSWVFGSVAAGLMLLGIRPLERWANDLSTKVLPEVNEGEAYRSFRRLQMYQVALAVALEDGTIGPEERGRLERLRRKLAISNFDAHALEADAGRFYDGSRGPGKTGTKAEEVNQQVGGVRGGRPPARGRQQSSGCRRFTSRLP